ncbi:uncharacterized protein TRIVIDRAFT_51874 [Trichoderma virens Gv29-8]|uniref:Efflux pump antibiotic resistance protein n=1 Tax=Hypocrea virens (strain Gv29-8 / FGSC 10586) TaxID=413071 RepID=G9MWI1_HYPVG|nr:uncharacterized protein TRIVIDRAFT_51874 [Trichoderma virens Gv29-8]EHK21150.1 hypothetical protein TRIVIDRAFT_51874 [Trichoderma virens Gv29-8]
MRDDGELNNGHAGKGLQVIHVALFRMATQSFAEAYRTLGYKTHHGVEDILGNPWVEIEQAAEATWPTVPNARPRPRFTRSDWDNLWGDKYDIVTDLACPFTDQLIQAYPDAKIVVVQRDFDSWWNSYQVGVLDKLFSPGQQIFVFLIRNVLGSRAADAMLKVNYGLFKATSVAEIREHAREVYDEYYRKIRETIPAEKRLEYTMGDGWEPLCAFLGKDVPDIPFPRLNDSKARSESQRQGEVTVLLKSARKFALLGVGAGIIATSFWYYAQA